MEMCVVFKVCQRECRKGGSLFLCYRGLVKWYDRGLQNLWWGFDSLIPCSNETRNFEKSKFAGLFFVYDNKKFAKRDL